MEIASQNATAGKVADTAASPPAPAASLRGIELALGTVALSLATFMNVLDTSIANVSIPAMSGDLGVSPDGRAARSQAKSQPRVAAVQWKMQSNRAPPPDRECR